MKSDQKDCAPETIVKHWKSINWRSVKQSVRSLQSRIAKATREGKHNKVKALQWMLTHSFAAKLLAVKRVKEKIQENEHRELTVLCGKPQLINSVQPYL